MTLSERESKKVEKAASKFMEKRRPPPHIRPELDLGFRLSGQNIEIFEIRPVWNNPKAVNLHRRFPTHDAVSTPINARWVSLAPNPRATP